MGHGCHTCDTPNGCECPMEDENHLRSPSLQAGGPGLTPREVFDNYEPFPSLTRREREVAILICEGRRNQEIADELGLAVKTVDTHRGHIIKKLEVANNVLLTRLAIREGWVKP